MREREREKHHRHVGARTDYCARVSIVESDASMLRLDCMLQFIFVQVIVRLSEAT